MCIRDRLELHCVPVGALRNADVQPVLFINANGLISAAYGVVFLFAPGDHKAVGRSSISMAVRVIKAAGIGQKHCIPLLGDVRCQRPHTAIAGGQGHSHLGRVPHPVSYTHLQGAHAQHEQVQLSAWLERVALLTQLVTRI